MNVATGGDSELRWRKVELTRFIWSQDGRSLASFVLISLLALSNLGCGASDSVNDKWNTDIAINPNSKTKHGELLKESGFEPYIVGPSKDVTETKVIRIERSGDDTSHPPTYKDVKVDEPKKEARVEPGAAPRKEVPKKTGESQNTPQAKIDNDRIKAIDEVLRSLEMANIAFNAPESLNIEDTARIQLLLSIQKSADQLKSAIEAAGKIESAEIRVSDRMEAELTGTHFEITSISPKEQAIGSVDDIEWNWEVKPKASGRNQLHLTLTAILSVGGKDTRRAIRTFDKIIEVEVTPTQKIFGFFESAWQWLWAAILVPIVGWFWNARRRKHPPEEAIKS